MSEVLTKQQVIDELKALLAACGSLAQLGKKLNAKHPVRIGYLCDVLNGRKKPGPQILKPMGIVRGEVLYRRVRAAVKP